MPRSVKLRLAPFLLLAALAALVVAGCGGSDDGGGSGGTDPAGVVPAGAPVFIDVTVRPEAGTKANIEALVQKIAGIDDLGELIVEELESSAADDGEELDFDKEVEPWLGEEAGIFLQEYEDDDFEGYGAAIQASDEEEARSFVEKQAEADDESAKDDSYEGVEFQVQEDGTAIGVFDGLVAFAQNKAIFKSMVDAADGGGLAEEEVYANAVAGVPDYSAADVYVDIGRLIEESGGKINSETKLFLDSLGIEPNEATAVASLVPGSDQIEILLSTDLSGDNPPSGDAHELLGEMPADSVVAIASSEFGKRFGEGIDQIDNEGIPGEVPPNQLKEVLKQAGIDLEEIAGSIGDVSAYVQGTGASDLRGALILEADDATQAKNTVSNMGLFLRKAGIVGVTAIDGEASGFSIRSPELGPLPVVVVAKGTRIAVAYGLASARRAFGGPEGSLLGTGPYNEALIALGGTPISVFVNGPEALKLANSLVSPDDEGFNEAKAYLRKIQYVAIGSNAADGLATADVIVGLRK